VTQLDIFQAPAGYEVRTVLRDGEPWFVAGDVCKALGITNSRAAVARLDEIEKGVAETDTLGGQQKVSIVSEAGLYRLVMRSNRQDAIAFQMWIAHEVLPAIRKTGTYSVQPVPAAPSLSSPDEVLALAERYVESAKALVAANSRLAIVEPKAEAFAAIEGGDGVALRVFHKKYFSDVKETAFFEHLYRKGYLIDQRGKGGWSERRMKYRDGAQHRHPSYKGKPFLYLHASVDDRDNRHETPRVRPGTPELAFRDVLVREGLPPNASQAIERKAS
jgi:prophage antirepressor-like protein